MVINFLFLDKEDFDRQIKLRRKNLKPRKERIENPNNHILNANKAMSRIREIQITENIFFVSSF